MPLSLTSLGIVIVVIKFLLISNILIKYNNTFCICVIIILKIITKRFGSVLCLCLICRYNNQVSIMVKEVRVPVEMSQELKEKAKKDSKEMFGKENVSQFIRVLIKNHKAKK